MTRNEKLKLSTDSNTSPEVLKELANDEDQDIRKNVASNPNTPIDILEKLSEDFNYIKSSLTENPSLPVNILERLSKNQDRYIRRGVAKNPNTSPEILEKLSKDEDYEVRRNVARNPNTPIEILKELSKDKENYVRESVVRNPNTPIETLIELSKDERYEVGMAVARNLRTPIETLIKLSKDEDYHVRREVAENPNTPIEILQKLSNDKDMFVKKAIFFNPNTLSEIKEKIFNNAEESLKGSLSANNNTPTDFLDKLSKDKDVFIKRNVASNPNTSSKALKELANDEDQDIRKNVAKNPNTSIDTLEKLANDESSDVRRILINNNKLSFEIIKDLIDKKIIYNLDSLKKDLLEEDYHQKEQYLSIIKLLVSKEISNENKEELLTSYLKFLNKANINKIQYSFINKENQLFLDMDIEKNNCKFALNKQDIFSLNIEQLKIEKPIINTKEEAIKLIEKSTSRSGIEKIHSIGYSIEIEFQESNPYKDLPEKFKNDLDVIIAALKIDSKPLEICEGDEYYFYNKTSKSLNIYELLPDSIKNSKDFQDKVFNEFVLPRCRTSGIKTVVDYIKSLTKELYENKDSDIDTKTKICNKMLKAYNSTIPSYENQLYDIHSSNYENEHFYNDDIRHSEDSIKKPAETIAEVFNRINYYNGFFNDGLVDIAKEVDNYKSLKIKEIEEKISSNIETFNNFLVENNININSKEAIEMKSKLDETQEKLSNELKELKPNLDDFYKKEIEDNNTFSFN